ncbi:hypothetical protein KI688_003511 [Linnemannia hyalina]|uniref:Uncharacterized protein n=1 Tax=Linnemannia hyalina TaxID=64524 RepID=A0A9P7XPL5_9FUNG|nr:hypothetical protein KI688_003511 [Linnemannia hyalina]
MQLKTATSIVLMTTLMSLQAQAAPVGQQDTNALTIATPPTQSLIAPMPDTKHYKNPQPWDWNEADQSIQADPNATDYTPENEENAKWGGSSFWNPWGCGGWNNWNWSPWWNTWNSWC